MPTSTVEIEPSAPAGGVSKSAIAQELRLRIVRGEFLPGSRLPTRSVLEQQFGTTTLTVQRAFDDLAQDGFITTDGRRGTFVADAPPHLTRHALVFTSAPSDFRDWSPFWQTLCAEAARIEAQGERKVPCYFNVNQHHDSEDFKRLLRDIRLHQLAGVMYAFNPDLLENTGLFAAVAEAGGTPSVAIGSTDMRHALPVVTLSYASFFERALEQIAQRGRQRVAVFAPESLAMYSPTDFHAAAAARGLSTQPYWWQPASLGAVATARYQAHLLMNPDQRVRPDALIIANDNLVEPVIEGLRAAGVRVPEDVEIVAHCNFPLAVASPAPMRRLGFNVRHVLRACLESIDCQRQGSGARTQANISAVFEDEIPFADASAESTPPKASSC